MQNYIFDSYAFLAYYQEEKGANVVKNLLAQARKKKIIIYLSEINLGEVYYTAIREFGPEKARLTLANLLSLPVSFVAASRVAVLAAAEYKAQGKLSYADCFVLQLARERKGTIVTGDPEFKSFEKEIKILWL